MGTNTESVRLRIRLNICEEHKVFLWLPPKTASEHAVMVFSLFSFENYICDYDRQNKDHYHGVVRHDHNMNLFEGHEEYKLICTARNPIHRIFSAYVYNTRFNQKASIQGFREFFNKTISEHNSFWLTGTKNLLRTPDYFIRQENLFEDYLKIPFVRESKITKCGVLEELCRKRINYSKQHVLDIRECYTTDMIDYLYYEYKWYFDTLGYEPKI